MRAHCSADAPTPGRYMSINGRIVLSRSTPGEGAVKTVEGADLADGFVNSKKLIRQGGAERSTAVRPCTTTRCRAHRRTARRRISLRERIRRTLKSHRASDVSAGRCC